MDRQSELLSRVAYRGESIVEDTMAQLSAHGRMIDVEDVLIGATALARNFAVVTNNLDHFRRIPGLRIEDWTV